MIAQSSGLDNPPRRTEKAIPQSREASHDRLTHLWTEGIPEKALDASSRGASNGGTRWAAIVACEGQSEMRFGGRAYKLEDVERIAALGLSFAEINLLQGDELIHRPQELMAAARRWNLHYLVHAHNEGDPRDVRKLEKKFFQDVLRLLDLCGEISAPLLTVHFWMDGRFIPREVLERKRLILWEMARAGSRKGVQVCLENLSERAEDLRPVLEGCAELGLTLDVGHGQLLTSTNRVTEILGLWPTRILHLHAHDNRGGYQVGADLHLPIGEGIIDFQTIFRDLRRVGYEGRVTLEVPVDQLEPSLKRLRGIMDLTEKEEKG